ncbi:MFS transporter [Azospirillum sp.]|uniref:spinster family MFS transporter n=1 Tax=Azospirillum sp. TaxID=34012 RepID=UPI002D63E4B8|nr:MFS transporter [Azospirillum sp.]HYF88053.1 MFS transporter [Azospirillum sp.]
MTSSKISSSSEMNVYNIYTRHALLVLMLSCALNFLDRQVVNILAEPIKQEFSLSDTQLGILTGLAFAAFHATLTLPMAWLADRGNRVLVIAASVAVWSIATVASGMTSGFGQLLVARMFVGVGEAGGIAPAHSLIADYVSKRKRATAIAFFSVGIPLGGLLGLALGGLVMDAYGWRTAFIVAGVPGLILAPLMVLTLRDPKRSGSAVITNEPPIPFTEALREIFSKKAFLLVAAGGASMMFVNFGQSAFIASFFFRAHGEALKSMATDLGGLLGMALGAAAFLGLALGLARGLTGVLGVIAGGWITDRIDGDGYRAYATLPAIAALIRIPVFTLALLISDAVGALTLLAVHFLISGIGSIGGFTAVQGLVRPRARATAAAIYGLGVNLIGLGLGPLFVGLTSDALATSGLGTIEGLRWALVVSSVPLLVVAGLNWRARGLMSVESVS